MSETSFILILEPKLERGEAIAAALREAGYACSVFADGRAAVDSLKRRAPDVVIATAAPVGEVTWTEVLRDVRRHNPSSEALVLVDEDQSPEQTGAIVKARSDLPFETVSGPFDLADVVQRARTASTRALRTRESRLLQEQIDTSFEFSGILGHSEAMRRLVKRVQKIARSKSTVLITGETGVGKELVAQAIHANSPRAGKPFKVLNCAAVSESLVESELFGHVRGAFTGALADRKGIVEAADEGTLFLDEIGDMPLPMQAKLLRAIELGEVVPIGSTETRHVDVRFVSATNRDLQEMVANGRFREDLFYRLHAHAALRIPPLRERREDIPVLVHRFIQTCNREHGTAVAVVAPEVMRKLVNYDWPGNVRELRNVIERMCIESESEQLRVEDLPDQLRGTTDLVRAAPLNLAGMSLADVEKWHIMNTLNMFDGNREQTAKALGIGARTLYRKLREFGLK